MQKQPLGRHAAGHSQDHGVLVLGLIHPVRDRPHQDRPQRAASAALASRDHRNRSSRPIDRNTRSIDRRWNCAGIQKTRLSKPIDIRPACSRNQGEANATATTITASLVQPVTVIFICDGSPSLRSQEPISAAPAILRSSAVSSRTRDCDQARNIRLPALRSNRGRRW